MRTIEQITMGHFTMENLVDLVGARIAIHYEIPEGQCDGEEERAFDLYTTVRGITENHNRNWLHFFLDADIDHEGRCIELIYAGYQKGSEHTPVWIMDLTAEKNSTAESFQSEIPTVLINR